MSVDEPFAYQVSDRYGDMIVVVRGNNIDELAVDYATAMVTLRTTRDEAFGPPAVMDNATRLAKDRLGAKTISEGPACRHGAMVLRSGRKGKNAWQGYFCSAKSKGCEVVWKDEDNEDEPWWD